MELWKYISDNRNYMISNKGRVRSYNYKSEGKLITPNFKHTKNKKSHTKCYVVLCKNYGKKAYPVNELVYKAFIGDIPEGYTVYNKNHNQSDNRVENLLLIKKKDNLLLKLNNNFEGIDMSSNEDPFQRYIYYINKKKVGELSDFMHCLKKQSKQNISKKFITWENDPLKDKRGILIEGKFCFRKKEVIKCLKAEHYNRIKKVLNEINQ